MQQKKITDQAEELVKDVKTRLEDGTAKGRERKLAALSYVFILCLIPLWGDKKSSFVQFHAKQGLMVFILDVFAGLLAFFPILGLIMLVISIMGFYKALNGEQWEIPFIYEWSKKISL